MRLRNSATRWIHEAGRKSGEDERGRELKLAKMGSWMWSNAGVIGSLGFRANSKNRRVGTRPMDPLAASLAFFPFLPDRTITSSL